MRVFVCACARARMCVSVDMHGVYPAPFVMKNHSCEMSLMYIRFKHTLYCMALNIHVCCISVSCNYGATSVQ